MVGKPTPVGDKKVPAVSVGAQVFICYLGILLASGVFYMIYHRITRSDPEETKLITGQLAGPVDTSSNQKRQAQLSSDKDQP